MRGDEEGDEEERDEEEAEEERSAAGPTRANLGQCGRESSALPLSSAPLPCHAQSDHGFTPRARAWAPGARGSARGRWALGKGLDRGRGADRLGGRRRRAFNSAWGPPRASVERAALRVERSRLGGRHLARFRELGPRLPA